MAGLNGCAGSLESIGDSKCITAPILSMIQGVIPEAASHSYASLSDFNDEDVNKLAIAEKGILPIKLFLEVEDASTEEITSETSTGVKLFHRDGKYGVIGFMRLSPDQNRILQTYDESINKCYLIDGKSNRLGTLASDGESIEGLTVSDFHVMPMDLPLTADGSAWSKIEVRFEYISEVNKTPRYSLAEDCEGWDPLKVIKPMTKLELTTGIVATNAFTVDVAYVDPTTGTSDTLSGADETNFEVKDQDGVVLTTLVITETSVAGAYTVALGAESTETFTSATIELLASADLLYYSDVTTASAAG